MHCRDTFFLWKRNSEGENQGLSGGLVLLDYPCIEPRLRATQQKLSNAPKSWKHWKGNGAWQRKDARVVSYEEDVQLLFHLQEAGSHVSHPLPLSRFHTLEDCTVLLGSPREFSSRPTDSPRLPAPPAQPQHGLINQWCQLDQKRLSFLLPFMPLHFPKEDSLPFLLSIDGTGHMTRTFRSQLLGRGDRCLREHGRTSRPTQLHVNSSLEGICS